MEKINAIGRRKTAIARVYLTPGSGDFTVNGKTFEVYFPTKMLQNKIHHVFQTLEKSTSDFTLHANITGGGVKGQAEALVLAVSRALVKLEEENKPALKKEGLLTRDSRKVERKKYGRKKARKKPQFSKR